MPCLQLISCLNVQFLVRLSENMLKNCVIIVWLLLMKLKCTFKYKKVGYFNFICFITFKKVDMNTIVLVHVSSRKLLLNIVDPSV